MKTFKYFMIAVFVLALSIQGVNAQTGFKVVVNKSNTVSALSQSDVSRMFLKKTTKWSDGIQVEPVDLSSDSAIREAFTKDVLKKTISRATERSRELGEK